MSWTKDGCERSGLRRRGMGSAMGVGVWEGMAAGDIWYLFLSFEGMFDIGWCQDVAGFDLGGIIVLPEM